MKGLSGKDLLETRNGKHLESHETLTTGDFSRAQFNSLGEGHDGQHSTKLYGKTNGYTTLTYLGVL